MSDHGPLGGDEINRLNFESDDEYTITNFGWPISSYGEHYPGKINKYKKEYAELRETYRNNRAFRLNITGL